MTLPTSQSAQWMVLRSVSLPALRDTSPTRSVEVNEKEHTQQHYIENACRERTQHTTLTLDALYRVWHVL